MGLKMAGFLFVHLLHRHGVSAGADRRELIFAALGLNSIGTPTLRRGRSLDQLELHDLAQHRLPSSSSALAGVGAS